MLIQGVAISVTYKKIEGIKKAYYNNEQILKEYFNEATVLPIPDDAPLEIPRIIIKTLHEHAQLNISPIAATFEVKFDAGFEKDWKKCSDYIVMRMSKVFEFLNLLTENAYEYIGIVSTVLYDEVQNNGVKKLSEVLLNSENIHNLFDINLKYTFVENEKMFVNIMLQNARMFDAINEVSGESGVLAHANQVAESIGVHIDINDRYSFNYKDNYKSNSGVLQELIDCMGNIIDNKLVSLIEKGVY